MCLNKVKEEVQTEIDDLKENFKRLDKTYAEIVSKEKTIENVDSNRTKTLNIVIKNIPSDPREISENKNRSSCQGRFKIKGRKYKKCET